MEAGTDMMIIEPEVNTDDIIAEGGVEVEIESNPGKFYSETEYKILLKNLEPSSVNSEITSLISEISKDYLMNVHKMYLSSADAIEDVESIFDDMFIERILRIESLGNKADKIIDLLLEVAPISFEHPFKMEIPISSKYNYVKNESTEKSAIEISFNFYILYTSELLKEEDISFDISNTLIRLTDVLKEEEGTFNIGDITLYSTISKAPLRLEEFEELVNEIELDNAQDIQY